MGCVCKFANPVFINTAITFVLTEECAPIVFMPGSASVGNSLIFLPCYRALFRAQNTCARDRARPRSEDICASLGTGGKMGISEIIPVETVG